MQGMCASNFPPAYCLWSLCLSRPHAAWPLFVTFFSANFEVSAYADCNDLILWLAQKLKYMAFPTLFVEFVWFTRPMYIRRGWVKTDHLRTDTDATTSDYYEGAPSNEATDGTVGRSLRLEVPRKPQM